MKQISRTTTTKIAEDELDPLSALAQQPTAVPALGIKPPLPSFGSSNSSSVGGFHIRDDADQRDKSEFVTVEKLKIVSSIKRESITPSSSSTALSHEGSPANPRQESVSPVRGSHGDEPRPTSLRLSYTSTANQPSLPTSKRTSGENSPVPSSQNLSPPNDSTAATDIFPYMSGEMKVMSMTHAAVHVISMGGISGVLYMTNYRIVFLPSEADIKSLQRASVSFLSWLNVPLACIDRIEREKRPKETPNAGITMMIYCKDCRQLRINIKPQSSSNGDYDLERAFSLMNTYAFPNSLRYLFAYNHSIGRFDIGNLHHEYERMGLFRSPLWRISHVNHDFRLCSTYPEELVVPCNITDDELHVIGSFRSGYRLPVLCWATGKHSASIWRSSQPKAGVSGSCTQDIRMLDVIARSTSAQRQKDNAARPSAVAANTDSVLYIVDARSRNSAMANMAAGAGYETQNYYSSCRLDFYNIPNIHAVRDSYKGMLNLVLNPTANPASDISFSKQIEDTNWLTNVRLILKASFETAAFVNKGYPVLVHCSHGWDRTAQITALAQLFLDPFYRTFEGFPVLIEKEWLAFGHQFQMRCAHGQDKTQRQDQEFSPIFIQFLDCLWQILHRFGQHFEFNAKYVLTIADHVYSGRFGTFLFSSELDRRTYQARTHSADLWQHLASNRTLLTNRFFVPAGGVFLPPLGQLLRGVTLWSDYFLRWSSVVSIPKLGTELAAYTTQLRQLEEKDPELRIHNAPLSNTNDSMMFEAISTGDYMEAVWAKERYHRLSVERELNQSVARHQRALETLLQLVRERVTGETMSELEKEIHRMEDEEALLVKETLASYHNVANHSSDGNRSSLTNCGSEVAIGPTSSSEGLLPVDSARTTGDDEGFQSPVDHQHGTTPTNSDPNDSGIPNTNTLSAASIVSLDASPSTQEDIVVMPGHLQLPVNLSSAECIEVLQTAAEMQPEAAGSVAQATLYGLPSVEHDNESEFFV